MPSKIEISYKTIIFTVFFLILLWFLVQIIDTIFLVFVAFIIMTAFKPWVDLLERIFLPRVLAIIIVYLGMFTLLGYTTSVLLPPLVSESIHLAEILPGYTREVLPFIQIDPQIISQQLAPIGENVLKVTFGIFGNMIAVFSIFVISFYLLVQRKQLEPLLSEFVGEKGAITLINTLRKVEGRLGSWVRGQATLMVFIGITIFIGLTLLRVPFALPLSILAGILEIVPVIGPIFSAIPAVLVALTITPFLAVVTTMLYFTVQQVEAHLVIPFVMRKAVGIPPLITIISLMVGGKLGGIAGAILAVPIVVTLETVFSEYLKSKEAK